MQRILTNVPFRLEIAGNAQWQTLCNRDRKKTQIIKKLQFSHLLISISFLKNHAHFCFDTSSSLG